MADFIVTPVTTQCYKLSRRPKNICKAAGGRDHIQNSELTEVLKVYQFCKCRRISFLGHLTPFMQSAISMEIVHTQCGTLLTTVQ